MLLWLTLLYLTLKVTSGSQFFHNFRCVTYDYDMYMNCTWDVDRDLLEQNAVNLSWIFKDVGYGREYLCPHLTPTSCLWNITNNDVDQEVRIQVTLILHNPDRNITLGSDTFLVDTAGNVKPSPVVNLTAEATRPECLLLSWGHSHQYYRDDILYQISLSAFYNGTQEVKHFMTKGVTKHEECGLRPFSKYTITARCRPKVLGYYSSNITLIVQTPPDRPVKPPDLYPGSYTIDGNHIMVYWELMDSIYWQGNQRLFVVQVKCRKQGDRYDGTTVHHSFRFKVYGDGNCLVTVWSQNEIGPSATSSSICINVSGQRVEPSSVFITNGMNPGEYEVHWERIPHESFPWTIKSFFVFWCEKTTSMLCQEGIGLKRLPSYSTHAEVPLDGYPDKAYMVGVAATWVDKNDSDIISSGFLWQDCSLNDQDVFTPFWITKKNPAHKQIKVKWSFPYCGEVLLKNDKTLYYQITTCATKQCKDQSQRTINVTKQEFVINDIDAGDSVCVFLVIILHGFREPSSQLTCFSQDEIEENKSIFYVITATMAIVTLIMIIILIIKRRSLRCFYRSKIDMPKPFNVNKADTTDPLILHNENLEMATTEPQKTV